MAFLQICRRRQAVFEGATNSLERLLTHRCFHSSCIPHRHLQNGSVCLGKNCTDLEYFRYLYVHALHSRGTCYYYYSLYIIIEDRMTCKCLGWLKRVYDLGLGAEPPCTKRCWVPLIHPLPQVADSWTLSAYGKLPLLSVNCGYEWVNQENINKYHKRYSVNLDI